MRETASPSIFEKEVSCVTHTIFTAKKIFIGLLTRGRSSLLDASRSGLRSRKKRERKRTGKNRSKSPRKSWSSARRPKNSLSSTVTTIDFKKIEQNKPMDLSEAIRYAPGVTVTFGDKYTYALKLRGIDSKRIALLIDGVPDYEPYYSSFDLKTVSAAGIDSLQITKGPSSVLYGPNTLGGIVNVITRQARVRAVPDSERKLRRKEHPECRARRRGPMETVLDLSDNVSYQDSGRILLSGPDNGQDRAHEQRLSEVQSQRQGLLSALGRHGVHGQRRHLCIRLRNAGGALASQKARYWKFKNWDRYTLNAGGYTSLGENSTLRFRAFYVNYKNTLDQWKDTAMSIRQFESTFDNSVYGGFALGRYISKLLELPEGEH